VADDVRAGIYTRISLASLGDNTKTGDQERICRDLAARLRWEVTGVYCDHSKSAWRKSVQRREWNRMLADVETGRINAIVTYHGDRLVRQPRDLEKLIDLAENKGIRITSPTGDRNLDNKDDRAMLRVIATFACLESDRTSERRQAQYARWRAAGRVRGGGRGGRAFGFSTDGITLVPGEAALIREAAGRVLAGDPAGAICRDLNARGARTPAGNPFTHHALRKMLARPRLAGLMPDGIHQAAWEPILDRETWEAVAAVLEARAAGYGHATNTRAHLLSGIARCSECGSGLQAAGEGFRAHDNGKQCVKPLCPQPHHWQPAPAYRGYRCAKPGCRAVQRNMRLLDEYVITRALAKLGDPRNPPGRVPDSGALAAEFGALARQRAEIESVLADHARGNVRVLLRRLESLDARLAQLRDLAAGSAATRLLSAHAGLSRPQWDALPLHTRRALAAALFTVTVLPASRRGPGFSTADVRVAPRGAATP
jgi:site-specific DNA recombinase